MGIRFFTFFALLWLALPFGMGASANGALPYNQRLFVTTLDGRTLTLSVDVADSPEKQAQGLMFVKSMPTKSGMVFPMRPPRRAQFWMRNTLIPLDMIFILPGGTIGQIETRRDTQSDRTTSSLGPVSGVLELNAGEAEALNIGIGDRVRMNGVVF